jgi:hypothetical protein
VIAKVVKVGHAFILETSVGCARLSPQGWSLATDRQSLGRAEVCRNPPDIKTIARHLQTTTTAVGAVVYEAAAKSRVVKTRYTTHRQ